MKCARVILASLVLLLGVAVPAKAGPLLIVGQPPDLGTGNAFPFGENYNATYQQVYASSDFSGPITITGLAFFNTRYKSAATSTPTDTYTIDLSTTSVGPATISGNFTSNVGADNTQVFRGSITRPWSLGDTLTIPLSTPFTYKPANGNLLLQVVGSGVAASGGPIYFDVSSTTKDFSRVYALYGVNTTNGSVDRGYGLITGFQTGSPARVPEPTSLALVGLAILAGGACCGWRRG
jgi:hypothetical protein